MRRRLLFVRLGCYSDFSGVACVFISTYRQCRAIPNHGFILTPSGWTLSDAFDINPNIQSPNHALALDEANPAPDLGVAFGTYKQYRLTEEKAIQIVKEVSTAVSEWEAVAKQAGLSKPEIDRMHRAFLKY